jgi:hypothetical protein
VRGPRLTVGDPEHLQEPPDVIKDATGAGVHPGETVTRVSVAPGPSGDRERPVIPFFDV